MSSSYQVIARKWRPRRFSEMVGQDHVVRTLRNAILRDRIAHAYLLVGPRGTGKTTLARIFAKALNCAEGPTPEPCGTCPACLGITNGSYLDVVEVDGASNNSVDQVRLLREDVYYAPTQGKYKVYIIDEVHMLTTQAFNALLKTLEEPPPHVKFVFATTEGQKVLPTIVSRCQRFDLKPIADTLIVDRLRHIAREENIPVDDNALQAIAQLADGGMRDAQSILDQLYAYCQDGISGEEVRRIYGLASDEHIEQFLEAMATCDFSELANLVDLLDREGADLHRVLLHLQSSLRQKLLSVTQGQKWVAGDGRPLTVENCLRMLDTLRASESSLKFGLSEKVNLEIALFKAAEAGQSQAIDSLLRRLTRLARGLPDEVLEKKK